MFTAHPYGAVSMTSQINSPSSQVEIQRLMELLNSNQQGADPYSPDVHPQPNQPLVEVEMVAAAAESEMLPAGQAEILAAGDRDWEIDTGGFENRFVAHISQAMSKTKSSSLGIL
jgi:hypothetical protein